MEPGILDLAFHTAKKRLLVGGIASRRVGTRSQEREAQAVQHAQQRAGRDDLPEVTLDPEGRRTSRPVVEKEFELGGDTSTASRIFTCSAGVRAGGRPEYFF